MFAKRIQLELSQYVEDMIINFERTVEINNGVSFNSAFVNKPQILKF